MTSYAVPPLNKFRGIPANDFMKIIIDEYEYDVNFWSLLKIYVILTAIGSLVMFSALFMLGFILGIINAFFGIMG